MTSAQKTVEDFSNFISESRADGLSWAEIERRLARKGCPISKGYLKVLYEKEVSRRTLPDNEQANGYEFVEIYFESDEDLGYIRISEMVPAGSGAVL